MVNLEMQMDQEENDNLTDESKYAIKTVSLPPFHEYVKARPNAVLCDRPTHKRRISLYVETPYGFHL
jgi:hypothetical protein